MFNALKNSLHRYIVKKEEEKRRGEKEGKMGGLKEEIEKESGKKSIHRKGN
jgi:hypothetical protein